MFNLNEVIERYNLNVQDVADALFPKARYSRMALDRVLKGKSNLDTNQLEALAKLVGVFVQDLYDDWSGGLEDGYLTFTKGSYKVKLNYGGAFMTLTRGPFVLKREIVSPKSMSLDEFINHINNLIQAYGTN